MPLLGGVVRFLCSSSSSSSCAAVVPSLTEHFTRQALSTTLHSAGLCSGTGGQHPAQLLCPGALICNRYCLQRRLGFQVIFHIQGVFDPSTKKGGLRAGVRTRLLSCSRKQRLCEICIRGVPRLSLNIGLNVRLSCRPSLHTLGSVAPTPSKHQIRRKSGCHKAQPRQREGCQGFRG